MNSSEDGGPSYRESQHVNEEAWGMLGDRLDLEHEDIQDLAAVFNHNQHAMDELPATGHYLRRNA